VKDMNEGKLKIAGTLNLLMGGIPLLYYGQELGMTGKQIKGATDGNDIPIREAFEWYRSGDGAGMSLWYKNTGPWWDSTNIKPNDGISLEEEHKNNLSLWRHYQRVIQLRKTHPALYRGDYISVMNDNGLVFTFLRWVNEERIVVAVNLTGQKQRATVTLAPELTSRSGKGLMDQEVVKIGNGSFSMELSSYGMQVFKLD